MDKNYPKYIVLTMLVLSVFIYPNEAKAGIFDNIGGNAFDSVTGNNLLLDITGAGATYLSASSGLDASLSNYFNTHNNQYNSAALPGFIWGNISPFVIGGGLFFLGDSYNDKKILGAAYAVTQASLLNISYVTLLKAITARPAPNPAIGHLDAQSTSFRFKFLHGGIYDGWPSGHVAATAAVGFTLIHYYPDSIIAKIYGYSSAAYMVFAVTAYSGGRMHWFSDGVAGLILGYTIGSTVGDNFRTGGRKEPKRKGIQYFSFIPLISDDIVGGQITIVF